LIEPNRSNYIMKFIILFSLMLSTSTAVNDIDQLRETRRRPRTQRPTKAPTKSPESSLEAPTKSPESSLDPGTERCVQGVDVADCDLCCEGVDCFYTGNRGGPFYCTPYGVPTFTAEE
jgi:hypothetical protein